MKTGDAVMCLQGKAAGNHQKLGERTERFSLEPSKRTNSIGTLALDLWSAELGEDRLLFFRVLCGTLPWP